MANEEIDPDVAALMAERQRSLGAPEEAQDAQNIASEEEDPEIEALMRERIAEDQNLLANIEEGGASETPPEETTPWWQATKDFAGNVVDRAKELDTNDATRIGGGAVSGYVLPKFLEEMSPGSTVTKANEDLLRQNIANRNALEKDIANREAITKAAEIPHGTRLFDLKDELYAQEQAHEESKRALAKAQKNNLLAQMLTHEQYMPPEYRIRSMPPPELLTEPRTQTSGATNWINKEALGVPEALANKATNMRADNPLGGQAIINQDTENRLKQERIGLGDYGLTRTPSGAQLALPPEIVQENVAREEQIRMEQERQRQLAEQQKFRREEAEKQAKDKLKKVKALSQFQLDQAQALHDENARKIREIEKAIAARGESALSTPEKRAAELEKKALQNQQREIDKYTGGNAFTKGAAFIGRKLLPRFSPIVAGAMAPEQAVSAKSYYEAGDYPRAAAYGLGSLGSVGMATGNPVASGVGALAQFPALYFEAEDLTKPRPKKP